MKKNKSEVRQVLVDVPVHDKNGDLIPDDLLSSGGPRRPGGSLIAHYSNPRLPEPTSEPDELDEYMRRENDARRRREEEAEERRRKDTEDFIQGLISKVLDDVVIPVTRDVIVPRTVELWDNKVKPGGMRLVQRIFHPKKSQPEVSHAKEDFVVVGSETASTIETSQETEDVAESATAPERSENMPRAEVIPIDEYLNRRSA